MRLVFFADTSTNYRGEHVFGNNDMRIVMPREKIYLFDNLYPSTSGYTVKWVNAVTIYTGGLRENATLPAKSAGSVPVKPSPTPAKSPLPLFLPLTALGVFPLLNTMRKETCVNS